MKVSFVVTLYNKVPYIPYMLTGLSSQGGEFEREYIFVDDGSSDGTGDLIGELTRDWPNTSIIRQKNAGPAPALNHGIAQSRGDLIKPMDGDDILIPGATLALMAALRSTGASVAFGSDLSYSLDTPGGPAAVLKSIEPSLGCPTLLDDTLQHSLKYPLTNPSAWLATSDIVKKSSGCDTRVFIQDYSIELRMARLGDFAKLNAPVFMAPEAAPGRLSDNQAQILHDCILATCHLLCDHPEVSSQHRRFAVQRSLGCAWKWRKRKESGSFLSSREFWAYLASRLGWMPADRETLIGLACGTFRRTHAIRTPHI